MQELARHLAGAGIGDTLSRAKAKFPTTAIAVLAVPGPWATLAAGRGLLTDIVVPRG